MRVQIWHIEPRSGFHFGQQGLGQEVSRSHLPSDSLFAALVAALARREGPKAVDAFCEPFLAGDPPFLLTSAFPRAGRVLLFPRPLAPLGRAGAAKGMKRVRYLSEALLSRWLEGEDWTAYFQAERLRQGGSILLSEEDVGEMPKDCRDAGSPLWSVEKRPRVSVDRRTQASQIYHTARLTFQEGCGLWFGLRWRSPSQAAQVRLEALFQELGDAGLGAERASGFGACTIQPHGEVDLPDPAGRVWLTLSRYLPSERELQALRHPAAAYRLERMGGWISSPMRGGQRRRPLNLLAEGSVLGPLEREGPGRLEDVRPRYPADPDPLGHPVYRSGYALGVGRKEAAG